MNMCKDAEEPLKYTTEKLSRKFTDFLDQLLVVLEWVDGCCRYHGGLQATLILQLNNISYNVTCNV